MNFSSLDASLASISGFIDKLIPLIISVALVLFLIGIVQYVTAGGDEEKRSAARGMIIFGIIALFVMVSVWGFVKVLSTTFGITYGIPSLPPESTKVFGN